MPLFKKHLIFCLHSHTLLFQFIHQLLRRGHSTLIPQPILNSFARPANVSRIQVLLVLVLQSGTHRIHKSLERVARRALFPFRLLALLKLRLQRNRFNHTLFAHAPLTPLQPRILHKFQRRHALTFFFHFPLLWRCHGGCNCECLANTSSAKRHGGGGIKSVTQQRLRGSSHDHILYARYPCTPANHFYSHKCCRLNAAVGQYLGDERSEVRQTWGQHSLPLISSYRQSAVLVWDERVDIHLGRVNGRQQLLEPFARLVEPEMKLGTPTRLCAVLFLQFFLQMLAEHLVENSPTGLKVTALRQNLDEDLLVNIGTLCHHLRTVARYHGGAREMANIDDEHSLRDPTHRNVLAVTFAVMIHQRRCAVADADGIDTSNARRSAHGSGRAGLRARRYCKHELTGSRSDLRVQILHLTDKQHGKHLLQTNLLVVATLFGGRNFACAVRSLRAEPRDEA
mmetsp:Transcript_103215/g.166410  ORF Transcript_103215/g.166410 Transcript_103215/m.166410 type:complete len:454 (+) Transcript_103215:1065-2426(+)